jgi:tetratricopeptide (TPR) repeat protein
LQLRQKLNQPIYLAETLSALGDVHTTMGEYDQALSIQMNALDVARKSNNTKTAAGVSQSIGQVLIYQGRLGAAVSAMQDSVNGFRATNNKSFELAEALNNLADALALAGRSEEAIKPLDEATTLAGELKNDSIRSELSNTRGDAAYYRGDYKAAGSVYEQALQGATKAKDREKSLIAKANLARVAIAEGRAQSAIVALRAAIKESESLHLKYYWLRSSVDLGEAMIETKDYAHGRQQLETILSTSEKLGLRLETARIHSLLGEALQFTGNSADAGRQYQIALGMFEELKKDPGADHLLDRSDLRPMYAEASHNSSAAK